MSHPTSTASGTVTNFTAEERKAAFDEAVAHVLSSWTILTLAVHHSWGGRNSEKRREELYNLLLHIFYSPPSELIEHEGRKVTCGCLTSSSARLSEFLQEKLENEFHIDIEDDDDGREFIEVAEILMKLARTIKEGDFTFYTEVMAHRSDGHMRSVAAPCAAPSEASSGAPTEDGSTAEGMED